MSVRNGIFVSVRRTVGLRSIGLAAVVAIGCGAPGGGAVGRDADGNVRSSQEAQRVALRGQCTAGNAASCSTLGRSYEAGYPGVASAPFGIDLAQASSSYARACRLQSTPDCANASRLAAAGSGQSGEPPLVGVDGPAANCNPTTYVATALERRGMRGIVAVPTETHGDLDGDGAYEMFMLLEDGEGTVMILHPNKKASCFDEVYFGPGQSVDVLDTKVSGWSNIFIRTTTSFGGDSRGVLSAQAAYTGGSYHWVDPLRCSPLHGVLWSDAACRTLVTEISRDFVAAHRPADPGQSTIGYVDRRSDDASSAKDACDSGSRPACMRVASYYRAGIGVAPDAAAAASYYRKECSAAEAPDRDACTVLGEMYRRGEGGRKDAALAKTTLARACQLGARAVCEKEGMQEEACRLGSVKSCDALCTKGNSTACESASRELRTKRDAIEDEKAERATLAAAHREQSVARARLPALFTECSSNRAVVERARVAYTDAARRNDRPAADRAESQLKSIEPKWSKTLGDIRENIAITTNDQGPEFKQLVSRVKSECSCGRSRSGRCGP